MSEPDNFLTRWARRKQDVADKEGETPSRGVDLPQQGQGEPRATSAKSPNAQPEPPAGDRPPFDLKDLPPIESISADTDLRPFFAPGVPADLARAALRRAWSADPTIRDFIGLSENSWDFNQPDAIRGFGSLEMTDDLRRMLARIVGDAVDPPPDATKSVDNTGEVGPAASSAPPTAVAASLERPPAPEQDVAVEPAELAGPDQDNMAVQHKHRESATSPKTAVRRGHGGALPQ
jgi:hypothetical protein